MDADVPFMHSMFVKAVRQCSAYVLQSIFSNFDQASSILPCCRWLQGDQDQGWHKDDNAIMNGRKLRHHRPMQVEVLYCACQ